MSTINGSVYRRNTTTTQSVYSDSYYPERVNGHVTPKPTMTYLEVPRAPSRARSPKMAPAAEVAAVDPTLEDAQKAGNNYHITMSLNAALAEAGFPANVAAATGRASQMEYATNSRSQMDYSTNSRSQMEYAMNGQAPLDYPAGGRSVSRIGVHSNDAVPIPAPRHSVDRTRNGNVSVIQIAGSDVIAHAPSPYPDLSQRDVITVNEGYSIRSVTPSPARKETMATTTTTVERAQGNKTVGFDLELVGGQTTTIRETVESGSSARIASLPKSSGRRQEASWENTYTSQRRRHPDEVERVSTTGTVKTRSIASRGSHSPGYISPDQCSADETDFTHIETDFRSQRQRPDAGMVAGGAKRSHNPNQNPRDLSGMIGSGTRAAGNSHTQPNSSGYSQREHRESSVVVEHENPWLPRRGDGYDDYDGSDPSWAIYQQLVKGAPPGTVHQRVTVDKDEDDIVEDGPQIKDMLNVDTVSEKVLVFVGNNIAEMTIKVKTERIVPIKGSTNIFRKSAVTVNRVIEVDMMATAERQRIYHNVIEKQRSSGRDLNQKETFDLYKAFLRLADSDEGNVARDQVRIDKTTDEARLEELNEASGGGILDSSIGQNAGGYSRSSNRVYRQSGYQQYGGGGGGGGDGGYGDSEVSSGLY